MQELYGLNEDTPLDDALHYGSDSEVTYEEYCELHEILRYLSTVQMIAVEWDSMTHFFQYAAHGLNLACMCVECAVQCDSDLSNNPVMQLMYTLMNIILGIFHLNMKLQR
jgi:hypothetical protein